ncbi:cytochrome d ubiquinol oxidase subunit II [Legionella dresdenensis]|uniref:Cytochrome d ubiquinol oxidase subunit II n=1 Tax=Legionella dresdenensis TaxID=450200 RepID=A0ABV8CCM8_9GAMM
MGIDLPLIWFLIIGFGLMMYIVMDGFDLGIGILFPFISDKEERDLMVNTVAPVWDGNETWLVLCGVGILAAFPKAYATILTALYLPLILMLCGLIWRGVAFEFRFKATENHKPFWDKAFIWGSFVATFFQGVSLGAFINGFKLEFQGSEIVFIGGSLDWLTPFSVFTGFGLVVAYALLGCTWLIMKTENQLQKKMLTIAKPALLLLLMVIVIVSIWTPLSHEYIANRWFSLPNLFLLAPFPFIAFAAAWFMYKKLGQETHTAPFILTLIIIFTGYLGLGISLWPDIIPHISMRDVAAPEQSMGFALVGALFIIPFILVYTSWAYYVFRGKINSNEGYH